MYPYLKEIDLGQAELLQQKVKIGTAPLNLKWFSTNINSAIDVCISDIFFNLSNDGKLFCDALTYATHILNQAAPPEGWGYAAYELGSGMYDKLPYYRLNDEDKWKEGTFDIYEYTTAKVKGIWNRFAFKLTDLARVEAETDAAPITPITDWEAKYKELQDRLVDAQNCIAEMEAKYNQIVKAAKYALDRQQTEQKTLDNYADAKCKSEIAVYQFYNLLNN